MPHQGVSLEVVWVRTRETMSRPEIAQLIMRGARACGFRVPAAVLAELCLTPGDSRLGTFVALVDGEPRGVLIAQLPMSAFMLAPMIVLAYSERAPTSLVRLVAQRLRAWLLEAGYDEVLALNLRHTDRAVCRGLAHFGVPRRAGGVIAFRLTREISEGQRV